MFRRWVARKLSIPIHTEQCVIDYIITVLLEKEVSKITILPPFFLYIKAIIGKLLLLWVDPHQLFISLTLLFLLFFGFCFVQNLFKLIVNHWTGFSDWDSFCSTSQWVFLAPLKRKAYFVNDNWKPMRTITWILRLCF